MGSPVERMLASVCSDRSSSWCRASSAQWERRRVRYGPYGSSSGSSMCHLPPEPSQVPAVPVHPTRQSASKSDRNRRPSKPSTRVQELLYVADGLADRSPGGVDDCGREELGQASAIDPPSRTTGITSAEHVRRRSSPGDTEVPSIKTPRAVVRSSSSAYGTTTMSCAAPEGTRTSLRPPPEPAP